MSGIKVTSAQFADGANVPATAAHPSVGGQNRSPQLAWDGVPEGTASVAVTCWDPDAPTTVGFCHWVRYGIPPSTRSLPEAAAAGGAQGHDGFTDFGESRYGGMAPPAGDPPHRYIFTVHALDTPTPGFDGQTTYAKLRFLVRGHVLAEGSLTGLFAVAG